MNMSLKELKSLDVAGLAEREADLRKQLFTLRNQAATEKVSDFSQFKKLRADIARVQTLRRQQELSNPKK
jgi:ribosomal protein L29